MSVNTTAKVTELIFFSSIFFYEINGVNGVSILQKGVYKGKETCHRGMYVWYMLHFANTQEKVRNIAWRHL
jgi:hypothetical protein